MAPKTFRNPAVYPGVETTLSPSGAAVQRLFDQIASGYDRFNACASLGMHQRWRRTLVDRIPSGARVLDIATGTGDVAFLAAMRGHAVCGLDFSEGMIAKAREKDASRRLEWIAASAETLPFDDETFGCITSAFGLRNFRGVLPRVLQENFRVLKPGGRALHMDFGRPEGLLGWGHRQYLRFVLPLIGRAVCGAQWPGEYLEKTIAEFYSPPQFKAMLSAAGFDAVSSTGLLGGGVQLYEGRKPC